MSRDTILIEECYGHGAALEDGVVAPRYSYDNLRTQGWLDGHECGLDSAAGFLRDRAVELFRAGRDEEATRLRKLVEAMVDSLASGMRERSARHAREFPIVLPNEAVETFLEAKLKRGR